MIKKRLIAMGLTICMLFGNTNAVFADFQIQSVPAVVEETQETIDMMKENTIFIEEIL